VETNDYGLIKKLVLEECFSTRSTVDLSRKMDFKFDKCKRWLDNTKILRWDEFVDLCTAADMNLSNALEVLHYPDSERPIAQNIFLKLKFINSFNTNQEIADYLNCHASVVQRYLIGKTVPDMEIVFKLIDKQANMLASFIYRLFNNNIRNPFLLKIINRDLSTPIFETQLNISSMIQACLCIKSYKEKTQDSASWLSDVLELSLDEVQSALEKMLEMEIIEWDGVDCYKVLNRTTNLGVATFKETIPFYKGLHKKLYELLEKKENDTDATTRPGVICARVYPASKTSMATIRAIILKAHADILKTLEEDQEEAVDACGMLLEFLPITKL
jgi:predicted transcriptional regulator